MGLREKITDYDVCKAYQYRWEQKKLFPFNSTMFVDQILYTEFNFEVPEKVCYRAMERAEKRGYIEYGVSLRSGWLTEKGKQLIKNKEKEDL